MGTLISKFVEPTPSEMPQLCAAHPQKNKRKRPASPSTSAGKRKNELKSPNFQRKTMPIRKPRILTVTKHDKKDIDLDLPSNYLGRRRDDNDRDRILVLDELSEDFSDIESIIESIGGDESTRIKLRKFVLAWKSGLSSYTFTKIPKNKTDIPLAATSQCKENISRWQRCGRFCISCISESAAEHMEDDLTRKYSLDKFYAILEKLETPSETSIAHERGERRRELYDSVNPTKSLQNSLHHHNKKVQPTLHKTYTVEHHLNHPHHNPTSPRAWSQDRANSIRNESELRRSVENVVTETVMSAASFTSKSDSILSDF